MYKVDKSRQNIPVKIFFMLGFTAGILFANFVQMEIPAISVYGDIDRYGNINKLILHTCGMRFPVIAVILFSVSTPGMRWVNSIIAMLFGGAMGLLYTSAILQYGVAGGWKLLAATAPQMILYITAFLIVMGEKSKVWRIIAITFFIAGIAVEIFF